MDKQQRRPWRPRSMGPWNMLEFAQTALTFRAATLGGFVSPTVGPPDAVNTRHEPDEELPDSNIAEWERGRAVQRERARRLASRDGAEG